MGFLARRLLRHYESLDPSALAALRASMPRYEETYGLLYDQIHKRAQETLKRLRKAGQEIGAPVPDENFMEKLLGHDGSCKLTVKEAEVENNARCTNLFNAFDHLQKILDRFEELIR
jgi:hypothetical protein